MMRVHDSRELMLCRIHEVCPSSLLAANLWQFSVTGEYREVPPVGAVGYQIKTPA